MDKIIILTYNVNWKYIIENEKYKKNIFYNIVNSLQIFNPDIIAIQEAESFKTFNKIIPFHYKMILNKSGLENMITIFNTKRFKFIKSLSGQFEKGRPFCLLILNDLITFETICFINIHASHRSNTQQFIMHILNTFIKNNINTIIDRFVIIGDFNRNILTDTTTNFIFNYKNKNYAFNKCSNNHNTCSNLNNKKFLYNYDNVIDTKKIPKNYLLNDEKWYKKKSSDHLMVLSII
jgi:endonuclease/exonuclease/phosphatase family metal-dependent hydrolase